MIIDEELDIYEVLADRETRIMPGEDVLLQEMYDDIARENVLHPDDDFERIIEIMLEQIRIIEIMLEQITEEHG
jgi:hypothetical protein